ncbi:MAG TPA: hypothetical protein VLA88_04605 [Candidatus Saccharimonadales bacterium]|nr:hypothetical protein [Candidatus Saccharimonadales bacterium]
MALEDGNASWGDMVKAALRQARLATEANSANPAGYHLRGDTLLSASLILRLRHPNNPVWALDCLEAAEKALRQAEERAVFLQGVTLMQVHSSLGLLLLYRARLRDDNALAVQAGDQIQGPLQLLKGMAKTDPTVVNALTAARVIQSNFLAGSLLGYPCPPRLTVARQSLQLAHRTINDAHKGGSHPQGLVVVWLARAILEAHAGDHARLTKYATSVITLARGCNDEVSMENAQALLKGGVEAMNRLVLERNADMPDDVYAQG